MTRRVGKPRDAAEDGGAPEIDLAAALRSKRASVRERAVEALGTLGTKGALRMLRARVSDPNSLVRSRVAEALTRYPSNESERSLLKLLRDADELVRVNAAEALSVAGTSKSAHALLSAAGYDPSPLVRAYSVEALGRLRMVRMRESLKAMLASEQTSTVLLRLVAALYHLGERRRWREVIRFLDDRDYRVRSAAAATLEELATPTRTDEIRAAIQRRLQSEDKRAVIDRLRSILDGLAIAL